MNLQQVKSFFDGTKTGGGLSIALFTPMITSTLVTFGMAGDDAATTVNIISAFVGGAITLWGIIDRQLRKRNINPNRNVQ
jgi:hypothetical protein